MSVEFQLFLSKLLPIAFLPEGLIALSLAGIAASAWLGAYRITRALSLSVLMLFWACATPIVGNAMIATLETQVPGDPRALPKADVAIVLGGAVSNPVPPREEPELNESVDRVWHAARLYRTGLVQRIVVVGGNLFHGAVPEAELIQRLLVELGVPAGAIELGTTSRNTYENALEAKAIMRRRPFESALLVTSAWHMPRALAIFKKAEIPVIPAACDFRGGDAAYDSLLGYLPHARAFAMTSEAIREWMGYYVYRWRGWL